MWTTENRKRYDRGDLRYESDLTDAEWALIAPVAPLRGSTPPAKRGGNKRTVDLREVWNGVLYVLSTGCQWRAIPKDLPPRSTVHGYLERWIGDRTLERVHSCAVCPMPRTGRTRSQSNGGDHRQPKRQKR